MLSTFRQMTHLWRWSKSSSLQSETLGGGGEADVRSDRGPIGVAADLSLNGQPVSGITLRGASP